MLGRFLDDSFAPEVRADVTALTVARWPRTRATATRPVPGHHRLGPRRLARPLGVALADRRAAVCCRPLVGRLVDRMAAPLGDDGGPGGRRRWCADRRPARNLPLFVVGLSVMAIAKIFYDLAIGAFVADRVPFGRRSRVLSLPEIVGDGLADRRQPLGARRRRSAHGTSPTSSSRPSCSSWPVRSTARCRTRPAAPSTRRAHGHGARDEPSWRMIVLTVAGRRACSPARSSCSSRSGRGWRTRSTSRRSRARRRRVRVRRDRSGVQHGLGAPHRPVGQGALRRARQRG